MQLLLAGSGAWLYDDVTALVARFETAVKLPVRHSGCLPRRYVVALIQAARLIAFPSIYESFGLPVLTSTGGPLQKVAEDASELVDPLDVNSIKRGIWKPAADASLRVEFARRGLERAAWFSSEACAGRLAARYRRLRIKLAPDSMVRRGPASRDVPAITEGDAATLDVYPVPVGASRGP